MKKLLILFLALIMCSGCAEKKNDDSEPVEEDINVNEDTALEKPVLTLKSSDFKEISVPVSLKNDTIPDELKSVNVSDLDFGEKFPVCYTAENRQDYYPEFLFDDNAEGLTEGEKIMAEAMKAPQKGQAEEYTLSGGTAYFYVNYDTYCNANGHSTAFFRYDIEKDELTEIVSMDSLDETRITVAQNSLKYFDGKLYYIGSVSDGENSVHYCVYALDTATGENKVAFDDEAFSDRNAPNYPLDTLVCQDGHLYAVDVTYGKGSDVTAQVIYGMNPETGEWSEVFMGMDMYKPAEICGGKVVTVDRNDERKVCIHTDSYDFVSPYRSAELIYADEKETSLLLADAVTKYSSGSIYDNCVLHVFDHEKMEHYSFDLKELGTATEIQKVKNGYLITNYDGVVAPVYYLIPEAGIAFQVSLGRTNRDQRDIYYYVHNMLSVNDSTVSASSFQDIMYTELD